LLLQLYQFFFQDADPLRDIPPVQFNLLLARAAGLAEAAALPLQVRPAAHQARRQVLQLRQFHLQLAFAGLRALGEDAQDQLGAVEHLAAEFPLEIALLAGRQFMIEDHRRRVQRIGLAADLRDLAAAGEQLRVRTGPLAADQLDAQRARAVGEAHAFRRALLVVGVIEIQADENGSRLVPRPAGGYVQRLRKSGSADLERPRRYSPVPGSRLIGRDGTTVEIACL